MSDYSDDVDSLLNALTDGDFQFFIDDFNAEFDLQLISAQYRGLDYERQSPWQLGRIYPAPCHRD